MRGRSLTAMLALVTGAIGVLLVYMYVQRVETRTTQGLQTRAVLVANRYLPAGTTADSIIAAKAFDVKQVPAAYVAPGAFSEPAQMQGLILADNIAAGGQISSLRFTGTEQEAFFSRFPKGTEALSLPMDYVRAVAGHVQSGDHVNAFVTVDKPVKGATGGGSAFDVSADDPQPGEITSGKLFGDDGSTFLLLPNIPVIEVVSPVEGGPATMVVAVTAEQAAQLVHAQELNKLWFTLVPPEDE